MAMTKNELEAQYREWVTQQLTDGAMFRVWDESPEVADFYTSDSVYIGSVPSEYIW